SKTRERPLLSHSSRSRRSTRSTTVAAQPASKSRSAGQELGISLESVNSAGASAIHGSHETKLKSPPRLRAWVLSVASFKKFSSDVIRRARKPRRQRSAL